MKLLIPNKKLNFNYFVEDKYEAGISLKGSEVKSLAKSNGNIDEAFCLIRKDELFILNMYIPPYAQDSKIDKIDTYRKRKLLMHKHEIQKIEYAMNKQKYTLIPSKVYINDNKIKIEIVLAKHKKMADKREDIKLRDNLRISKKIR